MEKPNLTLYLGGTRSGKSRRAEEQARTTGGPVLYVATATLEPDDPAMLERIRTHRARRPAAWQTLECPLHLAERLAPLLLPAKAPKAEGKEAETAGMRQVSSASVPPGESPAGENPVGEAGTGTPGEGTVLLDCVTLWVSNILFSLPDPEDLPALEAAVRAEVDALLELVERSNRQWILVSGETGLGGIAPDRISRNFADALGLANQLLASRAGQVFLVVAGRLLPLAE